MADLRSEADKHHVHILKEKPNGGGTMSMEAKSHKDRLFSSLPSGGGLLTAAAGERARLAWHG